MRKTLAQASLMGVDRDDEEAKPWIRRQPDRGGATRPPAGASVANREHVALTVSSDKDGRSGLQHLVWVLGGSKRFEAAGSSVEGEHTTGVGVFSRTFGRDEERVACAWREPERREAHGHPHPMVVAGGYELGSFLIGRPEAPTSKSHRETRSRPPPAPPQHPPPCPRGPPPHS